jgi:hypothetical protein
MIQEISVPRIPLGSRWNSPGRRYAGNWRHNPWINAAHGTLQDRGDTGGGTAVDAASADVQQPIHAPGSNPSQHHDNPQDQQQRAAVRAWENEGGNLGIHSGMGR